MFTGSSAGLQPVKVHSGAGHTGVVKNFYYDQAETDAIFRGSPITLDTGQVAGLPKVKLAAPGDRLIGSMAGMAYVPSRAPLDYIPHGPAKVKVNVDPEMEFIIGANAEMDLDVVMNQCFNLTAEVGDRCYGFSTVAIDSTTGTSDPTLDRQVRILRLAQAPYGTFAEHCATENKQFFEVCIVRHQYKDK